MRDNDHLFVAYWRAVDAGNPEQIRAAVEQILDDLADHLASMAGKTARQLHSPLAEFDDLVSVMQVKVLQTLAGMPPTIETPGGYLVRAAQRGLIDYLRRVVPHLRQSISLDEQRPGLSGDGYTLLDLLPASEVSPVTDATLSPGLAAALATLRPSEQVAIQDEYQFSNWTPRQGQRPVQQPRRDNLYHAHAHIRALCRSGV